MKSTVKPQDSDDESDEQLHYHENAESDIEDDVDDLLDKLNSEKDDTSSEEEVLRIHSDSDSQADENEEAEDDAIGISDSDISQIEDDLPDSKAWGKKKKAYYNADNINNKTSLHTEKDEEAAKMEEEEARLIQKRLLSEIDNADLTFDLLTDVITEKKEKGHAENFVKEEKIEVDLSQMSNHEKLILLKKESPELLTYIDDYKRLMTRVRDELLPVLRMLRKINANNTTAGLFIESYKDLILNYCTNITFYIMLKLRKIDTKNHPCSNWLNEYRNVSDKSDQVYEKTFKFQIDSILKSQFKTESSFGRNKKLKLKNFAAVNLPIKKKGILENIQEDSASSEDEGNIDEIDEPTDGKRPITYQMAKNKGLTPHRKKELRNPRVKHRMKYRKAKIRRKGQVREVRKEVKKYDGEFSGIKAGVVKSIKFKA